MSSTAAWIEKKLAGLGKRTKETKLSNSKNGKELYVLDNDSGIWERDTPLFQNMDRDVNI